MSRTRKEFSRTKLYLRYNPETATKPKGSKSQKPTTIDLFDDPDTTYTVSRKRKTARELKKDILDLCREFASSVICEPTETFKIFTLQSGNEPATIDYDDIVKFRTLKQKFATSLPILESVGSNLDKLGNYIKQLGEKSLANCDDSKTTRSNVKGETCPLLPIDVLERFFLNYVILINLLNDPSYNPVQLPLKCYANLHKRILCSQLQLETGIDDTIEKQFKNLVSNLQTHEQLAKMLQVVSISTVFDSLKNYRQDNDAEYNISEIKSNCLVGPYFFYCEIHRLLRIKNLI